MLAFPVIAIVLFFSVGCASDGAPDSARDASTADAGAEPTMHMSDGATTTPNPSMLSGDLNCFDRSPDNCLESDFCTLKCPPGSGNAATCVPECTLKPCSAIPVSQCPEGACRVSESCSGPTCTGIFNEPDQDCGPHGYHGDRIACCDGLVQRCGTLLNDMSCDEQAGFPICLDCGNGECETLETSCNCPEDCD